MRPGTVHIVQHPLRAGRRRKIRGGILFEVLLSVALFVGAAAFALGCVKSVFSALQRARREQEAVDLARSKMAELEAGLITLADLRGQPIDAVGSMSSSAMSAGGSIGAHPRWIADIKTHRSEFTGLSLVELTVRESDQSGGGDSEVMSFTLRQLMPLGRGDAEESATDDEAVPPASSAPGKDGKR
jgi:type IV secretory pathway TrbL component